ncbi:MAG: Fe-S cluster assembly protein SufD [Rhodospirillaceae bacterium]|nr:Fe-S cluster assembly protein SufD [Rhodospirillaceae bacterium]
MPDDQRSLPAFADQLDIVRSGSETPWLKTLRETARQRYLAGGLPTRKSEDWKFTDLRRVAEADFLPPVGGGASPDAALRTAVAVDGPRVVLVNGRFDAGRSDIASLPEGVAVDDLAGLLERDPQSVEPYLGKLVDLDQAPVAAFNTAAFTDGVVIRVSEAAMVEKPIHVVSVGEAEDRPVLFHPRILVILEAGASATMVESHVGEGTYFTDIVAEVHLGEKAVLNHYKLQNESYAATHLAMMAARLESGATLESFVLQLGAKLGRHEVRALLDGRRIECKVNGAYLGTGEQHLDNLTFVDHAQPESRSRQVYKGVLDGKAHGVFQGKILVRPDAQKTDGHQLSRVLLLSPRSEMSGKPELEIYADDVKCSHGATVGELDEDPLFYLRCRGIDEETARKMLVEAFVAEVIEEIGNGAVRESFVDITRGWLESHGEAA